MLIRNRRHAIVTLAMCCGLAIAGCKERPIEQVAGEKVELSQLPAPVKATVDQQAQGRTVSEIERHTANGATRYAVTLGAGNQRQELILDDSGKVVATNAREEDDD
jgi:hypothetical protein